MLGLPSHLFVNAFNHCVDFVSVVVYVPTATYSLVKVYTSLGKYDSGMCACVQMKRLTPSLNSISFMSAVSMRPRLS